MFKPSKNFWRGFHQWTFIRGQETDPFRSGPHLTEEDFAYWLPPEMAGVGHQGHRDFIEQCIMNMHDRTKEEDYFAPRVMRESALWLEQNQDSEKLFLTVEAFDPHEPWLPPSQYRRMYLNEETREQVVSAYDDHPDLDEKLLARTRANYSGEVTLCDRWFGHFIESMRVLGLLDESMVILTSDHGHSIGDRGHIGKRSYPSSPEVVDVPLMVRLPGAECAGQTSEMMVQHHDVGATILDVAGVTPPDEIEGFSFIDDARAGRPGPRDHVTVGWGSAPTVITRDWWLNCKADGSGALLHDLRASEPFARNVAFAHQSIVDDLFAMAKEDAGGTFPEWILRWAAGQDDAPGSSDWVARS
jgi:arylsulfatase A-like enzyme